MATCESWQILLRQLNDEYTALGAEDPPIELYDAVSGRQYMIESVYEMDGAICLDVKPKVDA